MSHCFSGSGRKQDKEQAKDALNFRFSSRNWGGGHCDLPGFSRAARAHLGSIGAPWRSGWVRVWLAHFPLLAFAKAEGCTPRPSFASSLSPSPSLFSPPHPPRLPFTQPFFSAFTLPPFPSLSLSLFLLAAAARSCIYCILLYTVLGLSLNQPFAERACVVAPCALQSKQDLPHINRDA